MCLFSKQIHFLIHNGNTFSALKLATWKDIPLHVSQWAFARHVITQTHKGG